MTAAAVYETKAREINDRFVAGLAAARELEPLAAYPARRAAIDEMTAAVDKALKEFHAACEV